MRRVGLLAGLVLAAGALLLFRQAPEPAGPRDRIAATGGTPPERLAAVAFGTSLTARARWPETLKAGLEPCGFQDVSVTVRARPGAGSGEGLDLVGSEGPGPYQLAFVEFAINDADLWDGVSRQESLENTRAILRAIRDRHPGIAVVLVTTNPVAGLQRLKRPRLMAYDDLYLRLAEEEDVSLFDGTARWAGTNRDAALPDGLHPEPTIEAALYTGPLSRLVAAIFGRSCAQ
ncbi:MAG: SGNH/GDSL hydrolase family protein [Rhodobacteraceae bacterium]|nr:SGNH/GDSL hydrolase family protein [Paracoccaceae bacterium]